VNTQTFAEIVEDLNQVWSSPLQVAIALFLLWRYLGVASLAGLGTLVVIIPINIFLAKKAKELQVNKLKYQDARIHLTTEILAGIKTIKLNGWELPFQEFVKRVREKELAVLLRLNIYFVVINFTLGAASFLVTSYCLTSVSSWKKI
jgi:ABC-type bacteriocin/lantibiotic exporter with double-glycine peptidase domain